MTEQANPLARLETAHRMLAEARSVDEVKELRDKAEVARLYARERDLGLEAQNYAAEIKIRAERKLGDLLAEMPKHPGAAATQSNAATPLPPRLSDLGISRDESSRWQQMASIPEPEFEAHIAESKAAEKPLTTAGVVRLAKPEPWPEPVAMDLTKNGFDPATLPPSRLSRGEYAYFAVPKLMQWMDVPAVDVADAADFERLGADIRSWRGVVAWLEAVIQQMEARQRKPLSIVPGSADRNAV